LGREIKNREELKQLQEKKQALMDKIVAEEAVIRDIQKDLKKKCEYAKAFFFHSRYLT